MKPRYSTIADLPPIFGVDLNRRADYMRLVGTIIMVYSICLLIFLSRREFIGYEETDFINITIPDAERALRGEPMLSPYHPPLYPLCVAGLKLVLGGWLEAGLAVTFLSGIVFLIVSFLLFRLIAGPIAGWGAMLGLLSSTVFIGEWSRAGNDLLYFALFMSACYLAVRAQSDGAAGAISIFCGIAGGLAILTRSSGITLILLGVTPLLALSSAWEVRLRSSVRFFAGLALPLAGMAAFGYSTDSNILPTNTLLSLTTSYFVDGSDRASIDAAMAAAGKFDSVTQLLLADPLHIIRSYAFDFYGLLTDGIFRLIEPLLLLFLFPGLFFLAGRHASFRLLTIAVVFAATVLLTNLKSFDARYYLFLVPLFGSAIALSAWEVVAGDLPGKTRKIAAIFIALIYFVSLAGAGVRGIGYIAGKEAQVATVVSKVRDVIPAGSAVVARKPHLAYYTNSEWLFLPPLQSIDMLEEYLRHPKREVASELLSFVKMTTNADSRFLFFGEEEEHYRPRLNALAISEQAPIWLEPVMTNTKPSGWTLYRFNNPTNDR